MQQQSNNPQYKCKNPVNIYEIITQYHKGHTKRTHGAAYSNDI